MSYVKDENEFVKLVEDSPFGHDWKIRMIEEKKLLLLARLIDILLSQNGIDTDELTSDELIAKFEKLVKEQEQEQEKE